MHDDQQAGRLAVRAAKRSAGVAVDAEIAKHAVEGKLAATSWGWKQVTPVSTSAQGVPARSVLDVLGRSVIGAAGDDLNAAGNLGVQPAQIDPAHREHIGEAADQAAKIRAARAVRAVRETSQCVSNPILAERSDSQRAES